MYLAEIYAENFRIFGSVAHGKSLQLPLQKGINVLIGENDGGKSAIIDALRYCLWTTTSQEYHRFTLEDFHCEATEQAKSLVIRCRFDDLSVPEEAAFLEYLTTKPNIPPVLYVHLRAEVYETGSSIRIASRVHAGENGEGLSFEGLPRELLRATYLRPLRDAESELSPGKNSRLSQILISYPDIAKQQTDDFNQDSDLATTLVGIMRRAEHHLQKNDSIVKARTDINEKYLAKFQIGKDSLASQVKVASSAALKTLLEKLELLFAPSDSSSLVTRRGLGLNNALFMSAELLLLGASEARPLLLVEEPEAHLHPQLQSRVIDLLKERATDACKPVQVIMTTHSPYIGAAIPLEQITVVARGEVFPLGKQFTQLGISDYAFLERFLDATKANLFFARGVAIVEGDAENLLLPALAKSIGYCFSRNGVSVVNVGHTGLFRYSKIFQRKDTTANPLPIRVGCIRDRDIPPESTPTEMKGDLKTESELGEKLPETLASLTKFDGQLVRTFVSDSWTLEYDLAQASWVMAKLLHMSIRCAVQCKSMDKKPAYEWPSEEELQKIRNAAETEIDGWKVGGKTLQEVALTVYRPLRLNQASKPVAAQFAASLVDAETIEEVDLPPYLINAFKYLCGAAK